MGFHGGRARRSLLLAAVAGALLLSGCGEDYPTREVRLYVGSEQGTPTDELAREYARMLADQLGVEVQVHNQPGAGGGTAISEALSHPADGHTVGLASSSELTTPPVLYPEDAGYAGPEDWTGIGGVAEQPHALMAMPRSGWATLDEFVEEAADRPGELAVGVPRPDGADAMSVAALMAHADIELAVLAFEGGTGEASVAVLGEQAQAMHGDLASQQELLRAGELMSLGHTGTRPYAEVESVPYQELGYDIPWRDLHYVYAPPGLSAEAERGLAEAHEAVVTSAEFEQALQAAGYAPHPVGGEQMREELAQLRVAAADGVERLRDAGLDFG